MDSQVIYRKPQIIENWALDKQQVFQDILDLLEENQDGPAATFLDLEISIKGGGLSTNLYRKPTASNSLLHYTNFHLQHIRSRIPTVTLGRRSHRHIKGRNRRPRLLLSEQIPGQKRFITTSNSEWNKPSDGTLK
ncbi:uncharacterized protein ACNLHF_013946 [Anomaloglossus baeobatrachus]